MRVYQEPSSHMGLKRYRDPHDATVMVPVHDAKRSRTHDEALIYDPSSQLRRFEPPAPQRDDYQPLRSTHCAPSGHQHYDARQVENHQQHLDFENAHQLRHTGTLPHPNDAYLPLPQKVRHHVVAGENPQHSTVYQDQRDYGGHLPPPRASPHTYQQPYPQPRYHAAANPDRNCTPQLQHSEHHQAPPCAVQHSYHHPTQASRLNSVVEENHRHQTMYKQLPHPRASPRESQQQHLYATRQHSVIEEDRGRHPEYQQLPHPRASSQEIQQQHLHTTRLHSMPEENHRRHVVHEQLHHSRSSPQIAQQQQYVNVTKQHSTMEEDRGRPPEYQRSHHPRASPPEPRQQQQQPVHIVRQHALVEENRERPDLYQQLPLPRVSPQQTHQQISQTTRQHAVVVENRERPALYQQLPLSRASPHQTHQQISQTTRQHSVMEENRGHLPVCQQLPHSRASPQQTHQQIPQTTRQQSVAYQSSARPPVYQQLPRPRASPQEAQRQHLQTHSQHPVVDENRGRLPLYQQLPRPRASPQDIQQQNSKTPRHRSVVDENRGHHPEYQQSSYPHASPPQEAQQQHLQTTRHCSVVDENRGHLSVHQQLPLPRASPRDIQQQNSETARHRSVVDENRGRSAVHQHRRDNRSGTSTSMLHKMIQESVRAAKQHPIADTIATNYILAQQAQHHKHQKEEYQAQRSATQHNGHKASKQQGPADENQAAHNSEKLKVSRQTTRHKDKTSACVKQRSQQQLRACATDIAATRDRARQAQRHVDVHAPQGGDHKKHATHTTSSSSSSSTHQCPPARCHTSIPAERSRHGAIKARDAKNGKSPRCDTTIFNANTLVKALTGASPCTTKAIAYTAEHQDRTAKKEVDLHLCGDFERSTNKEREAQYNVYRNLIIRGLRARMLPADTFQAYVKLMPTLRSARKSRIQWLIDMGYNFRVEQETLHMAVQISDRFIARKGFQTDTEIILCVAGCMLVAIKFNEARRSDPSVSDYISYTKNFSDTQSLYSLERRLLRELDFSVISVTVATFITFFIEGSGAKHKGKLYWLSSFFADLSLFEIDMLVVPPDKLAAASLHAAIEYCMPNEKQTANYWQRHIETVTNFKDAEVCVAAKCLRTMARSYSQSHLAKKYARDNYGAVSQYLWPTANVTAFTSPPIAETECPYTGPTPRGGFHR